MNPEVAKYLARFTAEAREHLECLSDLLIRLEKVRDAEARAVHEELFRHAHSLKGGAGMMGLTASAEMAHHFEDWLGALRRLPEEAASALLTTSLIDALLLAVDHLGRLIQAESRGTPLPDRPAQFDHVDRQLESALLQDARRMELPSGDEPPSEASKRAAHQAIPGPCFWLRLTIAPSSQMAALRAFLAYQKLGALGAILRSSPSVEDLRAGKLPGGKLTLELSAGFADIERVVHALSELEQAEISALNAEAATTCPVPIELVTAHPVSTRQGEALADVPPPAAAARPDASAPVDHPDGAGTGEEPHAGTRNAVSRTLRVKAVLLDTLLDSVGDFILSLARLREQANEAIKPFLADGHTSTLIEGLDALHLNARSIHNQVLDARMTPITSITGQLTRAARDLARQRGRELDFTVSGTEVELDHAVLDVLGDPLLHLIRNAVDHGLEPPDERVAGGKPRVGHVRLTARREHAHVLIEIADDGRGFSAQKLKAAALDRGLVTPSQCEALNERDAWRLCFLPGLSTADRLSEISGRGVGMDVVKNVIESVGGSIDLTSHPGQGTIWSLALPYTVASAHVLFVRLGVETVGIPIPKIAHVTMAAADSFSISQGQPFFSWRGALLPVFSLGAQLGIETDAWPGDHLRPLMIVEGGERLMALQVDALLGQQRSILRPIQPPLNRIPSLSGITLRTNGLPAFILDLSRLFARQGGAF